MNRTLACLLTLTSWCLALAADPEIIQPPRDADSGKFVYQEVVPVDGVTATDLYSRAKAWVALSYRSAKDVIQLDDPAVGRLIARGNFKVSVYAGEAWIQHTLTMEVLDSAKFSG